MHSALKPTLACRAHFVPIKCPFPTTFNAYQSSNYLHFIPEFVISARFGYRAANPYLDLQIYSNNNKLLKLIDNFK